MCKVVGRALSRALTVDAEGGAGAVFGTGVGSGDAVGRARGNDQEHMIIVIQSDQFKIGAVDGSGNRSEIVIVSPLYTENVDFNCRKGVTGVIVNNRSDGL